MNTTNSDVVILGGGLAGMTLALQLSQKNPDYRIVIIEKNAFPVHDTTAKVGESTVEIGSHYLTEVLGLKDHFERHHLKKHGLRLFFGNVDGDCSEYDELGVSQLFGIPTYQIERGVLENYLHSLVSEQGIEFIDNAQLGDIELGDKSHSVSCSKADSVHTFNSRWVVDAAGRQAILKDKLGLKQPSGHKGNAIIFRVSEQIVIDEWSADSAWHERVNDAGKRWLSTNHLMGPGYWVWIIPLGSGATSFGIVLDDQAFQDSNITSFEDTMEWLKKEQPRCALALENTELLDFKIIQDYSYGCKKVFSADGWALTGEAGAFPDPLYSPGTDFIALSNTFITQFIDKDLRGEDIKMEVTLFQTFYRSFFESTLSLYKDQYGGFGDRKMMAIKLVWDYTYYWGVLTLLFFTHSITNIELMLSLNPTLRKAQALNNKMQSLLNERAKKRLVLPAKGLFMDQYLVPCLKHFNQVLKDPNVDVAEALSSNVEMMEKIVARFEDMLLEAPSAEITEEEMMLLGKYRDSVLG